MSSNSDITSGAHTPHWMTERHRVRYPELERDCSADVCIVGAGIAGLTTAYLLAKEGRSVVVLDDGGIASGESGRTSAHLSNVLDDRYFDIERLHGVKGAILAAESHARAIDRIGTIAAECGIDCEFERVDGYLFPGPGVDPEILTREFAAMKRAGMHDVRFLAHANVGFDLGPSLRIPAQAQFEPLSYLDGLATAIVRLGGKIHADTHVTQINGGKDARVSAGVGRTVKAGAIVIATNVPVNDRVVMHTKLEPYRTYMISARIAKGSVRKALYWDTLDPYHYLRIREFPDHDLALVGGEDHKVGHEADLSQRYERLEAWLRARCPSAGAVENRWSGQIIETVDALAHIGRNPMDHDNVFIITGDSGNGLTHGTIGGMLISDLICGRDNPWESLYSPARITLKATGEFAKHNANAVAQYSHWMTAGDLTSAGALAPDSGAVVRRGLSKIAAYRDIEGELTACSAICPHLGGIVTWNDDEKSWDCPVHGSRFDCQGVVVNGPANADLSPIRIDDRISVQLNPIVQP